MSSSKAQIGVEYMILFGFITLFVMGFLGAGYYYSNKTQDSIKFSQVDRFAKNLIASAESIYYAGSPSKTSISLYLPSGIRNITVLAQDIVFNIDSSSGTSIIAYSSEVPLNGTISSLSGLRIISLQAEDDYVLLGE